MNGNKKKSTFIKYREMYAEQYKQRLITDVRLNGIRDILEREIEKLKTAIWTRVDEFTRGLYYEKEPRDGNYKEWMADAKKVANKLKINIENQLHIEYPENFSSYVIGQVKELYSKYDLVDEELVLIRVDEISRVGQKIRNYQEHLRAADEVIKWILDEEISTTKINRKVEEAVPVAKAIDDIKKDSVKSELRHQKMDVKKSKTIRPDKVNKESLTWRKKNVDGNIEIIKLENLEKRNRAIRERFKELRREQPEVKESGPKGIDGIVGEEFSLSESQIYKIRK